MVSYSAMIHPLSRNERVENLGPSYTIRARPLVRPANPLTVAKNFHFKHVNRPRNLLCDVGKKDQKLLASTRLKRSS